MDNISNASYTLGIDCFPHGTFASIAADGEIKQTFEVTDQGEPVFPLNERTRWAVEEASELMGHAPTIISVACIDDGGDGLELDHMRETFDCIVDEAAVSRPLRRSTDIDGPQPDEDISMLRAEEAARKYYL